jgi:hypothetical protein
MKKNNVDLEARKLVRGFRHLPAEDQELLGHWFAPKARTIEEVCREIALNAPELLRAEIKAAVRHRFS